MDEESEKNLLDDYADIFLNTRESKEHKPLKSKYTHNKSRKSSIDLDKSVNKLKASLLYWDKTTLSTLIIRFYTILICQHLLSFLFCVITIKWFKLKEYLKENTLLFIIMFLIAYPANLPFSFLNTFSGFQSQVCSDLKTSHTCHPLHFVFFYFLQK